MLRETVFNCESVSANNAVEPGNEWLREVDRVLVCDRVADVSDLGLSVDKYRLMLNHFC